MIALVNADAQRIPLKDESVHAVVTSPPYYALRSYSGTARWEGGDEGCDHLQTQGQRQDVGRSQVDGFHGSSIESELKQKPYTDICGKCGAIRIDGQLGLEKRADCLGWATGQPCGECYICKMVEVFREVKRALRRDGVCFLNIGDSYASQGGPEPTQSINSKRNGGSDTLNGGKTRKSDNLKPKDMLLIPQRLALALQADGWWIRSDIIWAKPNPMPESVTDRPTKAHEYIWLLAKSKDYFWDQEGVRESLSPTTLLDPRLQDMGRTYNGKGRSSYGEAGRANGQMEAWQCNPAGRNLRTVWNIATQPYSGAHYATYPEALVERCIKAGTSERGVCPKCGKQWERVVEKGLTDHDGTTYSKYPDNWDTAPGSHGTIHRENRSNGTAAKRLALLRQAARERGEEYHNETKTLAWQPTCSCGIETTIPAVVLDPFAGSGTTCLVAKRMGRSAVGLDLSYQYLRENAWQRVGMTSPSLFT